jgi:heme exporter protein A
MLSAENLLVIRGGRVVLDGAGLAVARGGALLLRGRNGAGKSTLLRCLAGLRCPDAGRICWDGVDVFADRDAHAGRVAWLSHLDAVKAGLSVRENLAFAARVQGGDAGAALARMGLAELADVPTRMLSAGQKRRVALARMMLGRRPLWLLDEPTNGLDVASVGRLQGAIEAHRAEGGMVIAATHLDFTLPGSLTMELGAA